MSRSNPNESVSSHICTRWLEWGGATGVLTHYDKAVKENVPTALPFTFILLDILGTVTGWHDPSGSGIVSNEVKMVDVAKSPLSVRAFKGHGDIANGTWGRIKDKVKASGGKFTVNLYMGYRDGDALKIGCVQFSGAALNAWVDFKDANQKDIYSKAITITGSKDGQKGAVKFKMPTFALRDITAETNEEAVALDQALQKFLKEKLHRETPKAELPLGNEPEHSWEPSNATAAEEPAASDPDPEPF
jgi:hypothetical protein